MDVLDPGVMAKLIKTEDDRREALAEIESLIDFDPPAGSPEAERLELLAHLVEHYEKTQFPIALPDPVEAILFRMEQQDLTPRDLVPFLGSRSRVSEVLARKRPLTVSMVRALHGGLGIPAEVLIQDSVPDAVPEQEESESFSNYPLREMIGRGWLEDSPSAIRGFFSQMPDDALSAVLCRTGNSVRSARAMDRHALAAWTARVVTRANNRTISPYTRGVVTPEFMRSIVRVSRHENGPVEAQSLLAEAGLPLVIEPHLSHTYLDGAAILIFHERPVIGLTIRYDRLDNFWFTLMHELAHVCLHSESGKAEFYDDLDVEAGEDVRESEADQLASETLIPEAAWQASAARHSKVGQAAEILAQQLDIDVSIIAGRMRRHWRSYRILNHLVGHNQVRRHFSEIAWPD